MNREIQLVLTKYFNPIGRLVLGFFDEIVNQLNG